MVSVNHTFSNKTKHEGAEWKCSGPSGKRYSDHSVQLWQGNKRRILNWEMTAEIILEQWTLKHKGLKNDLSKALQPVWFGSHWAWALGLLILNLLFFSQVDVYAG